MPQPFRAGEVLSARKLNAALDGLRPPGGPAAPPRPATTLGERMNYLWPGVVLSDKGPGPAAPSAVGGYACEVIGTGAVTDELVPLDRPVMGDEAAIYPATPGQVVLLALLPMDNGEGFDVHLVFAFEKVARIVCT